MSDVAAGLLSLGLLVALLAVVHVPVGDYVARVFTDTRHRRVERVVYRLGGIDPSHQQSAKAYGLSLLVFSAIGVVLLVVIQMAQAHLPWSRDLPGVQGAMALNTAVSFVTNTNWQSYAGEATLGFATQMAGLTVQNFVSAAVGLAVAVALIRGFAQERSGSLGNFWVDLTRGVVRVLLPLAFLGAILLLAGGVVQNFTDTPITTLAGHGQVITGGPVASQEAIKELGTNGGGFFNANSAHPFENPNGITNLLEIFLLLLIPVSLTRTFGTMVGDRRQGRAILAVMATLWLASVAVLTAAEVRAGSATATAAGAAMEGKETRFGEWASALFAASTTATSTGAVNASHDSLTPTGGGTALVNMMLGELSPGGVGSGLYGILVMAILTVFIAGLMVGRTPEFLGKKIGARQMTLVALYTVVTPALVVVGTALAIARPGTTEAMGNPGGHGFAEVLYAFTSAANNNGSAFGGLTVTSTFFQISLAVVMALGRFVPIVLVLMLAGSLAEQGRVPATAGTLPTHRTLFGVLLIGVIVVITALTYFPALSLGPLAEALS